MTVVFYKRSLKKQTTAPSKREKPMIKREGALEGGGRLLRGASVLPSLGLASRLLAALGLFFGRGLSGR